MVAIVSEYPDGVGGNDEIPNYPRNNETRMTNHLDGRKEQAST